MKKSELSKGVDQIILANPNMSSTDLAELIKKQTGHEIAGGTVRVRRTRLKKAPVETVEVPIEAQIKKQKETLVNRKETNVANAKVKYLINRVEELEAELQASLAIKSAISPFPIEHIVSTNDSEAVAFVLASDFHLEELVNPKTVNGLNSYNLKIAEGRVKQFFQNTLKLLKKEQNATKIDTLVLALLGDIISGNIHDELLENCQLRPIEAIIMAENLIISGIEFLLKNSDVKLVIPCHVGNHTRITKKVHISTEKGNSLETFMYHHMENYFKGNPRVEFLIADGYLSYVTVFENYTVCLSHGHAVKYGGGVGGLTIPANKAIAQWEKLRHADLYCFGHFHQFFDGGNFICNGSLIGYNAFAVFIKGGFEKPKQAFFLVDKKRNSKTVVCPVMFSI